MYCMMWHTTQLPCVAVAGWHTVQYNMEVPRTCKASFSGKGCGADAMYVCKPFKQASKQAQTGLRS